jgi:tRNA dimethylallyltransferase
MITILGPTATGKTSVAVHLAAQLDAQIISADSRQVYRGMDLGTGKDLGEYELNGKKPPYHLIDIVDPGYEYNIFEFQQDFRKVYHQLSSEDVLPIFCGGSGMYLESVLQGYDMVKVPENVELRQSLEAKDDEELSQMLSKKIALHNISDTSDRQRLLRAIEIQAYHEKLGETERKPFPAIESTVFGIHFEREIIRKRITYRLEQRLEAGMMKEVEGLLQAGLSPEQLMFYGLEYKFLTQFVIGDIDYGTMFSKLNTAIHQFAKRQMTWFRRMEKKGVKIEWIDGTLGDAEKIGIILSSLKL